MPDGHVTSTKFWLGLVSMLLQWYVTSAMDSIFPLWPFMVISENKQRNTLYRADQFLIYTIISDFTQKPHQLLPNFWNWFAFYPWYVVLGCIKGFTSYFWLRFITTVFSHRELAKCPLACKLMRLQTTWRPFFVVVLKTLSDISKRKH